MMTRQVLPVLAATGLTAQPVLAQHIETQMLPADLLPQDSASAQPAPEPPPSERPVLWSSPFRAQPGAPSDSGPVPVVRAGDVMDGCGCEGAAQIDRGHRHRRPDPCRLPARRSGFGDRWRAREMRSTSWPAAAFAWLIEDLRDGRTPMEAAHAVVRGRSRSGCYADRASDGAGAVRS